VKATISLTGWFYQYRFSLFGIAETMTQVIAAQMLEAEKDVQVDMR